MGSSYTSQEMGSSYTEGVVRNSMETNTVQNIGSPCMKEETKMENTDTNSEPEKYSSNVIGIIETKYEHDIISPFKDVETVTQNIETTCEQDISCTDVRAAMKNIEPNSEQVIGSPYADARVVKRSIETKDEQDIDSPYTDVETVMDINSEKEIGSPNTDLDVLSILCDDSDIDSDKTESKVFSNDLGESLNSERPSNSINQEDCEVKEAVEAEEEYIIVCEEESSQESENSTSDKENNSSKTPALDYFEKEKDDLIDPAWNAIKALSTNEERYAQVKECWNSATVPNPNRNLSYQSYRKWLLNPGSERLIKQHKRAASNSLNDQRAKRTRSCTYVLDKELQAMAEERKLASEELKTEMNNRLNCIASMHSDQQNRFGSFNNPYNRYEHPYSRQVRAQYQNEVFMVQNEYQEKINASNAHFQTHINSLNIIRNEVLQFYKFYKNLGADGLENDPTILTNFQMEELEEIDRVYLQFDKHYK